MLVLTFTIYLIQDCGSTVKIISAFPPTIEYSESPNGLVTQQVAFQFTEGAKSGPHGIVVLMMIMRRVGLCQDSKQTNYARFYGYACVNCRKMENNVWSDAMILPILNNEVVLISLYVDDKRDLQSEQFISKTTGSEIETVGDKWTDFMISKYKTNTQPLYVLTV
jgi:thiol:disulfide interchange protein DsbD